MAGIAEQQLAQLPATPAKVDRLGRAPGLARRSRTSGWRDLWVKLERSWIRLEWHSRALPRGWLFGL